MTNNEYNEICDILISLQREFSSEEDRLKEISRGHAYRIDELDQQITTVRKNEDIDYRVFSPRNVSMDNSEKITSLEEEKLSLEKEKKEADKNMGYYSGKAEKLSKVIYILKKNFEPDSFIDEDEDNNTETTVSEDLFKPKKKANPFAFLDEEPEEDEEDIPEDNTIAELFNTKSSEYNYDDSKDQDDFVEVNKIIDNSVTNGVPVDEVERVCHKVEFSEKIINNDRVRAKLQLKEVVEELKELISAYK